MSTDNRHGVKGIKCAYISVWDTNIQLRSRAIYHQDTKEVEVLEMHDIDGLSTLEREYILFPDGTIMDICLSCHIGILETRLIPNPNNPDDKQLYEIKECSRKCTP